MNLKHRQYGSIAPFAILVLGGLLLAAAFIQDSMRMVNNRSQLKRAVDAAALAVADEWLEKRDNFDEIRDELAYQFVLKNLGMDKQLTENVGAVSVNPILTDDEFNGFTVTASFTSQQSLTKFNEANIRVSSTAEIVKEVSEVALMVDSSASLSFQTNTEFLSDALMHQEILTHLVDQLFGEDKSDTSDSVYVSVVPYSNEVNLYEPERSPGDQPRMKEWTTPGALTRNALAESLGLGLQDRGFYKQYGDLSNVLFPDRRAKRLAFFHGNHDVDREFRWENSPKNDPWEVLAMMESSNAEAFRPVASEVRFFALSATDQLGRPHTIRTSPGITNVPLLPLTNNKVDVFERLAQIKGDWQQRPMAGLLWSGATLSPEWRGEGGWGDLEHPLDYNLKDKGHNSKAIVMLMSWLPGWAWELATVNEYLNVCREFKERNIRVYAIIRTESMQSLESRSAGKFSDFFVPLADWLPACTGDGKRMHVFETGESVDTIKKTVDDIVADLTVNSTYVHLID